MESLRGLCSQGAMLWPHERFPFPGLSRQRRIPHSHSHSHSLTRQATPRGSRGERYHVIPLSSGVMVSPPSLATRKCPLAG